MRRVLVLVLLAGAGLVVAGGFALRRPAAVPAVPAADLLTAAADRDVRMLRALILEDPTLMQRPWTAGPDSAGRFVEGDVLWSPARQRGVMRLIGLPADVDPAHYAAWITTRTSAGDTTLRAASFTVRAGQVDVLIPLHAAVPVTNPIAFSVTTNGSHRALVVAR